MNKQLIFIILILVTLLAACSAPTPQATQLPPAATKAPALTATQAAAQPQVATATQPAAQPTTPPAATATQAPSGSGKPAVPAPYTGKANPLVGNASAIAAGKAVFASECADCHGANAGGSSRGANLLQTVKEASEAYVFWRVNEGGRVAPFNSRMPSFKNNLTETQIWQVISFLQSLK
jgi:mono/diheme cytochrome c family protein